MAGSDGSTPTCARPATTSARPATDHLRRQLRPIVSTGSGTGEREANSRSEWRLRRSPRSNATRRNLHPRECGPGFHEDPLAGFPCNG